LNLYPAVGQVAEFVKALHGASQLPDIGLGRCGLRFMGKAVFGADALTGAATYTVHGVLQTHDHGGVIGKAIIVIAVIVVVVIVVVIGRQTLDFFSLDQIEHIARADFETASAANTTGLIDIRYEGGGVYFSAAGYTGNHSHWIGPQLISVSAALQAASASAHALQAS
jgi:hypothetical protein